MAHERGNGQLGGTMNVGAAVKVACREECEGHTVVARSAALGAQHYTSKRCGHNRQVVVGANLVFALGRGMPRPYP